MKLSKRLIIIYSISFITAIIICFCFIIGFNKGTTNGEHLRASEISEGVNSSLHKYINTLEATKNTFVNILQNTARNSDEYYYRDLLNTMIPNDNFDYKLLMDSKNHESSNLVLSDTINTKYDPIIDSIIHNITNLNFTSYTGLIDSNNAIYFVSYSPILLDDTLDYIILISDFTADVANYLGSSTNSSIKLRNDVNLDTEKIYDSKVNKSTYKFKETSDNIFTYTPLNTLTHTSPLYLEIEQVKEVKKTITTNFLIFMGLTFLVFFSTNFILFKILETTIIKRILSLNEDIYNVDAENLILLNSSNSKFNDEITDLSKEISSMFNRISSATEDVRNNELKNREILNTMTNGFIYCKSITDSNNNIIDAEVIDINNSSKSFFNIEDMSSPLLSSLDKVFLEMEFISELNLSLNNKKIETTHEIKFSSDSWGIISINSIFDGYFFIIINDITKLKSYSEEMKQLATYDALTSIFNRRNLIEHIDSLEKSKKSYSLFFIDLDNFKKVNDTLGHDEGDVILKGVSSDLSKLLSKDIKIGRFGGDEFVVIKEGTHTSAELMSFGNIINQCISKEYSFTSLKFNLSSSIGVSSYPSDSLLSSNIMKYADIAMYNSKSNGGNSCSIFTKSLLDKYNLEDKIKEAIENNEFITYYQPIYNVTTNKIDSAEALVRWHSINGVIPPNDFIPVAKRTGSIVNIDKKVFTDACELCTDWHNKYGEYIIVSINISYSLLIEADFTDFVLSTIKKYNIPTNCIKLEITEDEIIEDISYVISLLSNLRTHGILVALDDFGVGYSSFSYIKRLPLDTIKIDRSLILSIENDKKTLSIIKSLIDLSKSLGLEVICEGIEVKNQLDLLDTLGCDKIQGFFFSKALLKDNLYSFVENFKIP